MLQRGVEIGHIGLMMAVMMDLHGLAVDVGFEGVGEARKGIKPERSGCRRRHSNTRHVGNLPLRLFQE